MDNQSDKGREQRQHPRFPFKQAVRFQIGEYNCPNGSLSRDLSRGGISLTVSQFVPVKGTVVLYLQRHQGSKVIVVKGTVSWIKMLPDSERYQVGIHFEGLDESVQREVNSIIVALG